MNTNNRKEELQKLINTLDSKILKCNMDLVKYKELSQNYKKELYDLNLSEMLENVMTGDLIVFKNEELKIKTMLVQDIKGKYDIMLLTDLLRDECEAYEYGTCLGYKCMFIDTLINEIKDQNEWEFLYTVSKNEKNYISIINYELEGV